jgi:PAP2 superfamily
MGMRFSRELSAPCSRGGRARLRSSLVSLATLMISITLFAADLSAESRKVDQRLAVAWNQLAYDLAFAEDQFLTFKGHRALAMMHLAIHDALNTVDPVYERYRHSGEPIAADPTVAAAQAAYEVLISQYPDRRAELDRQRASWIGAAEPSALKRASVGLGKAVASTILANRKHDGWDAQGTYVYRDGPGSYQTTPDWKGFVLQPGFREVQPFALQSGRQFRPPPPPPLTSPAYTDAFDEVKVYGAASSLSRNADQSAYAIWWMEFSEGSVNRLARRLMQEKSVDLWTANRIFALINMSLFDTYVAVWDSKYEYNHWRPYTAIQQADDDGNPDTSYDPAWEPLKPTPPFPEYVSAHAAGCAAAFAVLASAFGDDAPFTMGTLTAVPGMPTRSFKSFSQAAEECADSRVRLGWHFRYATDEGLRLGSRVADYILGDQLQEAR